ncbi:hypothetical protein [Marivita hallyeonensis]|uniref:Uncharacterized protein n=1 Tax=Marivita hallyeonensis TaxID=996342 RepID=A0A1M5XSH4_9RHOB|nr:hypothetical protein [Marivita hallyeonensis]SHI02757.1 hypothetical protein SAMN05443551_4111 [Marivita hallyeonensis]
MSFFRPEAKALLRRWREALVGAALLLLGAYWSLGTTPGPLSWIGLLVVLLGAALFFAGLQRGRARHGGGGPGVVQIIERRIGYFGPLNGGIVDLDTITSINFDPTEHPSSWVITHEGGPALHIPMNAEGADGLFDAFASLPGLSPGRIAAVSQQDSDRPIVLWRRSDLRKRIARLH